VSFYNFENVQQSHLDIQINSLHINHEWKFSFKKFNRFWQSNFKY
jgi:hypothetical protein